MGSCVVRLVTILCAASAVHPWSAMGKSVRVSASPSGPARATRGCNEAIDRSFLASAKYLFDMGVASADATDADDPSTVGSDDAWQPT
jgi:hypothetical protein